MLISYFKPTADQWTGQQWQWQQCKMNCWIITGIIFWFVLSLFFCSLRGLLAPNPTFTMKTYRSCLTTLTQLTQLTQLTLLTVLTGPRVNDKWRRVQVTWLTFWRSRRFEIVDQRVAEGSQHDGSPEARKSGRPEAGRNRLRLLCEAEEEEFSSKFHVETETGGGAPIGCEADEPLTALTALPPLLSRAALRRSNRRIPLDRPQNRTGRTPHHISFTFFHLFFINYYFNWYYSKFINLF